jgi:hypothetical protein
VHGRSSHGRLARDGELSDGTSQAGQCNLPLAGGRPCI